jgi:hypothetical protein
VDVDTTTLFPLGTTLVTFRFRDTSGNIGTATAAVTVGAPAVTVWATAARATEAGPTPGTCTVRRSGSTATALTVFYRVSGTATPDRDYAPLPGSVLIPSGTDTATIIVSPVNDRVIEADETVVITLKPHAAYQVGVAKRATVKIVSDERPTVTIAANDAFASEVEQTTGAFTVTRTGSTSAPLLVKYTVAGTATADVDYLALAGTVRMPVGVATVNIPVLPFNDGIAERQETVVVTITPHTAYVVGAPQSATVTITRRP